MRLSIAEISTATASSLLCAAGDASLEIEALTWDSREVVAGGMFVAMPGEKVDGNDFLMAALEARAALLLVSRKPAPAVVKAAKAQGCAILYHARPVQALATLAGFWRDKLAAKVVAVSGSSGKTSTKDLIGAVLASAFSTVASKANQNNEIGLPATVLAATAQTEVLVCEMGMRGLGQIAELCEIAKPNIAVLTNVGTAHLELLGSKDNIARAKAELVEALPDGRGVAVLNGDDPYSSLIRELANTAARDIDVLQFGLGKQNDFRADAIEYDEQGRPSFDLWAQSAAPLRAKLALQGQHSIYNALAATAVATRLGMDMRSIAAALEAAQPAPMRQQNIVLGDGSLVIDDSYNANPDSMRAALELLARRDSARPHIAVLGDMAELGESSAELHRSIGALVYASGVDQLLALGEASRSYVDAAQAAGMPPTCALHLPDILSIAKHLRALMNAAPADAKPIILIKGSRIMALERLIELLKSSESSSIDSTQIDSMRRASQAGTAAATSTTSTASTTGTAAVVATAATSTTTATSTTSTTSTADSSKENNA